MPDTPNKDDPVAVAAQVTLDAAQVTVDEIATTGAPPLPPPPPPPPKADALSDGFWTTVKNTAVAFAVVTLGGYFIWLGLAVNRVDNTTAMLSEQVKSLLLTRETQATENSARNTRKIEQLEKDAAEAGN